MYTIALFPLSLFLCGYKIEIWNDLMDWNKCRGQKRQKLWASLQVTITVYVDDKNICRFIVVFVFRASTVCSNTFISMCENSTDHTVRSHLCGSRQSECALKLKPYLWHWCFEMQSSPGCCGLPRQSHPSVSPCYPGSGPFGCSDWWWRELCDHDWGFCVPDLERGLWLQRLGLREKFGQPDPEWGSSVISPGLGYCGLGENQGRSRS